ncbi:hypothetical protein ACFSE0_18300 [Ochrobactrum teleogrylli]|uniref:YfhO family protein n=1 Tax=Ochrobactrum teleogrylli TaxID=2479765 RepID=A0ABY2Y560_9HYPH|nr:hypothetical protein FIC94_11175 [[Ochrobactrum] teleogrylli]
MTLPGDFERVLQPTTITAYHNTSVVLEGHADRDGVVILTDNWHPWWRAQVNGVDAQRVLRVEGTFRGIHVPKGDYKILLNYRPERQKFVEILCATGFGFILFLLMFRKTVNRVLVNKKRLYRIG